MEKEHDRILVTRNGRPSFVLISPDDLESLEETIDIMRDPELVASIRRSRDEAARGERVRLPLASFTPSIRMPTWSRRFSGGRRWLSEPAICVAGWLLRRRTPLIVEMYLREAMAVTTQITSREFNQDASGAKRAARNGPVFITDRGRPAHVLLTFADYEALIGVHRVLDLLGEPAGVADVEFIAPTSPDLARPASFD